MLHRTNSSKSIYFFSFLALLTLSLFFGHLKAGALSGADFQAGRIIDDSVFYNTGSMSALQIQQFLNAKVPSCDTNGSIMHSSGQTRASYGTSRGYPPPYTCLKDYTVSVPTITNGGSDLCKSSIQGGIKSAAQTILDVSQACGINPQVLIVLLQKEQSLITDDWPWSIQYRSATGYGCPDTAPCDSEYYGFFNQVYQAAKAFRRYESNPLLFNYRAGRNNYINYHPSLGACGGTNVFIENQATANLYIYTPYQPNAAALNNLYGTGDGCSAYGNRNFWRIFNDWFGSTHRINGEIIIKGAINISDTTPSVGQTVTASYAVQNTGSYSIDSGVLWICGEMNGKPFGGGSNRKVLAPGEILTITMPYSVTEAGKLNIAACGNTPGGPGWVAGYPYALYYDHRERSFASKSNPVLIVSAIEVFDKTPSTGETVKIGYAVKNTDQNSIDSGVLWICGEMNGKPFGGGSNRKVLAPGEILEMNLNYKITEKGPLTVTACGNLPNGPGWVAGHPKASYKDHATQTLNVKSHAIKIVGAIGLFPMTPNVGSTVTVGYAVQNTGQNSIDSGVLWICGEMNGKPFGGGSNRKVLAPGEILTITMPYSVTEAGKLNIAACGNTPGGPGWVAGYPHRDYVDHGSKSFSASL